MIKKPIPYHFFLCEIVLKKKNCLGMVTSEIAIVISLDSKIIILKSILIKDLKKFPLKKSDVLDFELLKKWIIDNHYSMSFYTKSKKLKLEVACHLDDLTSRKKIKKSFFSKINIFNRVKLFIKK